MTTDVMSRAALNVDEFCATMGIGRTKFYGEVREGRIRVVKAGSRTLVPATEVQAWLSRLATEAA